jgi:hypothetical protein
MDYTLSDAPEYVIQNIKNLQQIWKEKCDAIENNVKGYYSRHLLFILNDLREEIDNNKDRFSKNPYGKKFFKIQVASYCTFKKDQIDELDKIKREWTQEVNQELCFIAEALSDEDKTSKFQLDDISILIQRIENKVTSEDSFGQVVKILYNQLMEENINDNHIVFLVETLILLLNTKGMFDLESILDYQFEKFEDISTSEDVLTYDEDEEEELYPMLLGSPLRNDEPINFYREEVKDYYTKVTIQQRLEFMKEIYCREPQTYKVIFNIRGVSFPQKFNIGNVEFYNAKEDGMYINKNSKINKLYSRLYVSSNPNDFELQTAYCVAVDVQGVDNKFIAIKAKQIAERTIAGLLTRTRKDLPITLSNAWVICNSKGDIQDYNFKVFYKANIGAFAGISKNDYRQRLGRWISSENRCHPTVAKWLSSVDWYRQATESSQSSQEILNSWFAVEKFSEDSKILSKQLPKPSKKLLNNKIFNEIIDLWLGGESIRTIQLLLVVSELKFNLYNEVRQAIRHLIPSFSYEKDGELDSQYRYTYINHLLERNLINDIDSELQEYLSSNKKRVDFVEKFIEKLPEIKRQLDTKDKVFPALNELNKIFYNNDDCEKYLMEKIIELKDDVYNIYRIRNMLVHSSSTKSKLLDYYAKRSREYCHSLLDAIAYKIYQTSNDDEIMPLEFYFREMVIDANIALEAVKNNQMDKFRNWALS